MYDEIQAVGEKTMGAVVDKFCELCRIDKEKFKKENPNIKKNLAKLILPPKKMKFIPMGILYYENTDTYLLFMHGYAGNIGSIMVNSMLKCTGLPGKIYSMITGSAQEAFIIPIKPMADQNKIQIDMSGKAIEQLAMTLLLSDLDCSVVWPINLGDGKVGKIIMKTLDFICPSLIDLLSVCTFGGATVAARAAKLSKYAAKAGGDAMKIAAKSGSKTAAKSMAKKTGKAGLKVTQQSKDILNMIPKNLRHTVIKQKNKLKKFNKTSRTLKHDIRTARDKFQTVKEIKNEISNMSTDDLLDFSGRAIKILIQSYLPKDKKEQIDKLMSKIPDDMKKTVADCVRSTLKNKRGEDDDNKTTISDVIISAIPKSIRDELKDISES